MKHLGLVIGLVAGTLAGHAAAADAEENGASLSKIESRTLPAAEVKRLILHQLSDILIQAPLPPGGPRVTATLVQKAYWTQPRGGSEPGMCESDFLVFTFSARGFDGVTSETRYASIAAKQYVDDEGDGERPRRALKDQAACERLNPNDGAFFTDTTTTNPAEPVALGRQPAVARGGPHTPVQLIDTPTLDRLGRTLSPPERWPHRRHASRPLSDLVFGSTPHATATANLCAFDELTIQFRSLDQELHGADSQTVADGVTARRTYRFIGPPPDPDAPPLTAEQRIAADLGCAALGARQDGRFSADSERIAVVGMRLTLALNATLPGPPQRLSCEPLVQFECAPLSRPIAVDAIGSFSACRNAAAPLDCAQAESWAVEVTMTGRAGGADPMVTSSKVEQELIVADERVD